MVVKFQELEIQHAEKHCDMKKKSKLQYNWLMFYYMLQKSP